MDKADVAKEIMAQVPGAFAFSSPGGKDANDLLQGGTLGSELVKLRWEAARTEDERHRMVWDLWDGANECGLESGTASTYRKLCDYMGRHFDLMESQPGVWVTANSVLHTEKREE